jgi:hypothetical protein
MPKGIYSRKPFTKEHILNIAKNHRGMSGKKHSVKTKEKQRLSKLGNKNPMFDRRVWNKNTHIQSNTGKTHFKKGIIPWNKGLKGYNSKEKSHFWKGGITPLSKLIRGLLEYRNWILSVFERNNYTCQKCFIRGGKLHSHHIKPFSFILKEFLDKHLNFDIIKDKNILLNLAQTYKPFWNIKNGITLCEHCHKIIHLKDKE